MQLRGPREGCVLEGRGITGPYLNMRPHQWGTGVRGEGWELGALGGQNQAGG